MYARSAATPELTATPGPTATPEPDNTWEPSLSPTAPADAGSTSAGDRRDEGANAGGSNGALSFAPIRTTEPPTASDMLIVNVGQIAGELAAKGGASIEIVGAREIMTDEEYQIFGDLSLTERIMVMLSVAARSGNLTDGLPVSALRLTQAAQTLIREIAERLAVGEGNVQLELWKAPVGGVERTGVTLRFELVRDGAAEIVERSFYFDAQQGEWVSMESEPLAA